MKQKIVLAIVLLLPISATYADTPVATDSQKVCENRINAFKSSLETAIKKKQNVDEAREALEHINNLPSTLSPCEKQKQIPALSKNESSSQTSENLKDGKTPP